MRKIGLIHFLSAIFLLLIWESPVHSQEIFWIKLTDKHTSTLNPYEYFNQKAIERRIQHQIPLLENSDLPVSETYLNTIQSIADSVYGSSRWLNVVLISAHQSQLDLISNLKFVQEVCPLSHFKSNLSSFSDQKSEKYEAARKQQVESLGSEYLSRLNLKGKGITIAIFDGGFPGVDSHDGLQFLVGNNQILNTWNFPDNSTNVYKNDAHGTAVLSCIAGDYYGKPTGLASDANFLLARTELKGEPWKEQLYWIQAAEWADKNGANIICSSLGYTAEHYFPEEMDGTSPIAVAAKMAFEKGILVVNSIGNEGEDAWKILGTPADAEEVLSIGAIDIDTGIKMGFSSFGPNQDGIMKPNVMASGKVLAATSNSWRIMYGTSFSAPLIAGYAACLWQKYPFLTNKQIFELVERTANLYPYFDYAHGFGIPNAENLSSLDKNQEEKPFQYSVKERILRVRLPATNTDNQSILLYFHIANPEGAISEYKVIKGKPGQLIEIKLRTSTTIQLVRLRAGMFYSQIAIKNDQQ